MSEGPVPRGRRRARGRIEHLTPGPETPGLDRDLTVYLPPAYDDTYGRYPVLYMQDGQNLFDPEESFAGSWRVDLAMNRAAARGAEAIVVGIPNAGEGRIVEYNPFDDPERGPGRGGEYVTHMVEVIKPLVDARYRTLPGRETTAVVGSSMGGLISLFAFFVRPDVFGVAAALSPSLWFAGRAIFGLVEEAPRHPGRLYLDVGQQEGEETLHDARRLRDLLLAKGYVPGEQLRYVEERAGAHEEAAWSRRFRAALPFLVPSPE
ncbi:MAG TPA: alpha/beta hydrolase-fold protein [Gemmatimonadales bacterium]|nr:alpha/beta hydrolase-fold protein [Gemmatimonadales bacterium]